MGGSLGLGLQDGLVVFCEQCFVLVWGYIIIIMLTPAVSAVAHIPHWAGTGQLH